ncbi:MAG: ABC transporter ATP-binding protein/permease [Firmicutes bacterium]|nr:ABC transporter ATP-binding protein/permease [Bacillota bacterium]
MNLIVFLAGAVRSILATGALLLTLARFHPALPLVILATAVPQALLSFRMQNDAFELLVWKTPEARRMRYYSSVMLTDAYAKEVRIGDLSRLFLDLYKSTFDRLFAATKGLRFRQLRASAGVAALGVAGTAVAFGWVLLGIVAGEVTAGGLMLFVQALLLTQQNVGQIVENSAMLYGTLLYMEKLMDFLDARPLIADTGRLPVPDGLPGEIQFQGVSFAYPGGREVLHNVTFTLRPGEVVALVGENGAGKTTIVKLLARFYDPTAGAILVGGRDLREYDLASWRRSLAVVFQDFARFQLSARLNIGVGALEHADDLDRIRRAAEQGGADEVIARLPQQYETLLGKHFEGGVDLSGGEWQKIALSRAFLKDAANVVLDEPTAALDPRSEYEIYQRFAELVKGKTVLLISHRLSAVRMADRILVLDRGRIVEEGSHEELMRAGGLYAQMYRMQAERYADQPVTAERAP